MLVCFFFILSVLYCVPLPPVKKRPINDELGRGRRRMVKPGRAGGAGAARGPPPHSRPETPEPISEHIQESQETSIVVSSFSSVYCDFGFHFHLHLHLHSLSWLVIPHPDMLTHPSILWRHISHHGNHELPFTHRRDPGTCRLESEPTQSGRRSDHHPRSQRSCQCPGAERSCVESW